MAHNMSSGTSFSALQHLLQLAYSSDEFDQEIAARDLAVLVEGTSFPSVSFGPLAHALCKLIPSSNVTIATHSAKAMKLLILDDTLRPQANVAGVSTVVCTAVKQWEDQATCLRELLGALQTLCWDKQYVRTVLQGRVIVQLTDYISDSNQEVSVLALAILSNILSFSDSSLLLQDTENIEDLIHAIPLLLECCLFSEGKPQRFYSAAALANASAHPTLCAALKEQGAIEAFRNLQTEALKSSHILGSRLGECVHTALGYLTSGNEGDSTYSNSKYKFKWGEKSAMELELIGVSNVTEKHGRLLTWVILTWAGLVIYTFSPALFGSRR